MNPNRHQYSIHKDLSISVSLSSNAQWDLLLSFFFLSHFSASYSINYSNAVTLLWLLLPNVNFWYEHLVKNVHINTSHLSQFNFSKQSSLSSKAREPMIDDMAEKSKCANHWLKHSSNSKRINSTRKTQLKWIPSLF